MAGVNGVNVSNSVNFKAGGVNDKTSSPVNDNKPSNDKKMKTLYLLPYIFSGAETPKISSAFFKTVFTA